MAYTKNLVEITDIKTKCFSLIPLERVETFVVKGKILQEKYDELIRIGEVNIYDDDNQLSGIKLKLLNVKADIKKEVK